MNHKKIRKASGASGVAIELFKAGGNMCLTSLTNVFSDILFKDKLPEEWMLCSLVPIFKFVDLEKAFDWVPEDGVCFALRRKGAQVYLVNGAMSFYKGCKTAVSVYEEVYDIFCETWYPSRVWLKSIFISHGNGCSERTCERWFINEVAVCRRSCFV